MTGLIALVKKSKYFAKGLIRKFRRVHLSAVTRIDFVKTEQKVVAMTFDDGPCAKPCNPDNFGGKSLTEVILSTLEEFGARGTFDIIGDTSSNYPDEKGELGTPYWSGIAYDHYPVFGEDNLAGAVNQPELVQKMIDQGHEIASHGYRHIIFGRKPQVYGNRQPIGNFDECYQDLKRLHDFVVDKFNYEIKLHRPPHYVDNIDGKLNAYDLCEKMGYQYVAAQFDGAGWLPSNYDDEVAKMWQPMAKLLEKNENAMCGQIIFQKDGYNMAERSPVADGLRKQLEVLKKYGYKVVPVSELLEISRFSDVDLKDDIKKQVNKLLSHGHKIAYNDNTLRLKKKATQKELKIMAGDKFEQAFGDGFKGTRQEAIKKLGEIYEV